MPLKLSLRPLASACRSCATQSKAFISSSNGPRAAPRYTNSNATRDLLDVDDSTRPGGRLDRSQASDSSKRADALTRILAKTNAMSGVSATKIQTLEKQKEQEKREQLGFWAPRRWKAGDVYAPHDLSPMEMLEWRELRRPEKDIVDILGINPLDHYKNFSIISEFITDMGRIKPSRMTGLRPVNQRKMAKAIRRAVGMGIHPSTHKHPMILYSPEDLKDFADLRAMAARKAAENETA